MSFETRAPLASRRPGIRCGAALRAPGWSRRSVPMGPHGLAARTYPSHRPSSPCTPAIRISLQRNLPRSLRLVMPIESHLPPSWKNGLRRCGERGPTWSITSTPAWVTASGLASVRAPKAGSRTLFAFGRNRSSEGPSVRMPWLSSEGRDEAVHSDTHDDRSAYFGADGGPDDRSSRAAALAPSGRHPRRTSRVAFVWRCCSRRSTPPTRAAGPSRSSPVPARRGTRIPEARS